MNLPQSACCSQGKGRLGQGSSRCGEESADPDADKARAPNPAAPIKPEGVWCLWTKGTLSFTLQHRRGPQHGAGQQEAAGTCEGGLP